MISVELKNNNLQFNEKLKEKDYINKRTQKELEEVRRELLELKVTGDESRDEQNIRNLE